MGQGEVVISQCQEFILFLSVAARKRTVLLEKWLTLNQVQEQCKVELSYLEGDIKELHRTGHGLAWGVSVRKAMGPHLKIPLTLGINKEW